MMPRASASDWRTFSTDRYGRYKWYGRDSTSDIYFKTEKEAKDYVISLQKQSAEHTRDNVTFNKQNFVYTSKRGVKRLTFPITIPLTDYEIAQNFLGQWVIGYRRRRIIIRELPSITGKFHVTGYGVKTPRRGIEKF